MLKSLFNCGIVHSPYWLNLRENETLGVQFPFHQVALKLLLPPTIKVTFYGSSTGFKDTVQISRKLHVSWVSHAYSMHVPCV